VVTLVFIYVTEVGNSDVGICYFILLFIMVKVVNLELKQRGW
jgi:hypothetical protein